MSIGPSRGSLIVLALLATAFSPTQSEPGRFEFSQVHMGMPVRVVLFAVDRQAAADRARAAFERISALDAILSDYRPDSELNRLAASGGTLTPVSVDLFAVLTRALDVARASEGAFDPTVGPLTSLWREARRTGTAPTEAALREAKERVGWRLLTLGAEWRIVRLERPDMRLDLGGIAKGYILQEALAVLVARGSPQALLEAGGDIVVGDAPPGKPGWRIEVPGAGPAFVKRASALTRAALATSGSTAQFVVIDGVRYSHVIDPRTGKGVTHGLTTSVIAGDGATADALATAIVVLGASRAASVLSRYPDARASMYRRPKD